MKIWTFCLILTEKKKVFGKKTLDHDEETNTGCLMTRAVGNGVSGDERAWEDSMKSTCGDVSPLYVNQDNYHVRCRSLRALLSCVRRSSEGDRDLADTWGDMVRKGTVEVMEKNVADTCWRESQQLCVLYSIQEDMQQCYYLTGLSPQHTFTTQYLSQHCSPMSRALLCMRRRVLLCPDDEYIQPQVQGVESWIQELQDACPYLEDLVLDKSSRSEHSVLSRSTTITLTTYLVIGCLLWTAVHWLAF